MALSLTQLQEALGAATTRYEQAVRAYETARRDETAARNALNEAQRAFDAKVDEIRKNAPRDTDWTHKTGRPANQGVSE